MPRRKPETTGGPVHSKAKAKRARASKSTEAEAAKPSEERRGPGRPSSYKPEFAEQARKICELGATDLDIANFFEVAVSTIYAWKITHPEFSESLKRGKEVADDLVEQRLFARATGYSHDAVKIFMPRGSPAPVYAPYIEHCPPDTTAAIFWLCNRRKENWRQRQELTGGDGGPIKHEHSHEVIDRPPPETREEWIERRNRELGAIAAVGAAAGSTN